MNKQENNGAVLSEEELALKRFEAYESGKFLRLMQEEWKTPDWTNFFIWREDQLAENGGFIAGCIEFDCIRNTYIDNDLNRRFFLHIGAIGIADEFRRCGFLGYACAKIISWADEAGVFVYGHARGFEYRIPTMHHQQEVLSWMETRLDGVSPHNLPLQKDLAQSRTLHKKYLEYGFKRFDGTGVRFANRKWKKLCFGYLGANCENQAVRDFAKRHLS